MVLAYGKRLTVHGEEGDCPLLLVEKTVKDVFRDVAVLPKREAEGGVRDPNARVGT